MKLVWTKRGIKRRPIRFPQTELIHALKDLLLCQGCGIPVAKIQFGCFGKPIVKPVPWFVFDDF